MFRPWRPFDQGHLNSATHKHRAQLTGLTGPVFDPSDEFVKQLLVVLVSCFTNVTQSYLQTGDRVRSSESHV